MAKDLQQSFLTETQDTENSYFSAGHQTPKTVAIVDTNAYTEFLAEWEALSLEFTSRLNATNDPAFAKILSRARSQTLAFDGYSDTPGAAFPSSMDIGQFFEEFELLCNIDPESSLKTSLNAARSAYKAMIVVEGVGPGTANATGMAILWPHLIMYKTKPKYYDNFLFNSSNIYATVDAPNWLKFLKTYYTIDTPQRNTTMSVCLNNIQNNIQPEDEDQLLLNPTVVVYPTSAIYTSEITFETDYVRVKYGINLTHQLSGNRRLKEMVHRDMQYHNGSDIESDLYDIASVTNNRHSRRTQSSEFFYMYGGNMLVDYSLINVQASWDRKFYYLTRNRDLSNYLNWTNLFVNDKGGGQKSFPVCYFPPGYEVTVADLEGMSTVLAILFLGCIPGEIAFNFSDESQALTLYVTNTFGSLSEMPIFAGGQIAPIAYVDLLTIGGYVNDVVGSYPKTILDWSPFTDMSLLYVYDDTNLKLFGPETTALVISIAYDLDRYEYDNITETYTGIDFDLYEYYIDYSLSISRVPVETSPFSAPTRSPVGGSGVDSYNPSKFPVTTGTAIPVETSLVSAPTRSPVGGSGVDANSPVSGTPTNPTTNNTQNSPTTNDSPVFGTPTNPTINNTQTSPTANASPVSGIPTNPTTNDTQNSPTTNSSRNNTSFVATNNGSSNGLMLRFEFDYFTVHSVIALFASWYLL